MDDKKMDELINNLESTASLAESVAGATYIESGREGYSKFIDARIARDKLCNKIASNADDIKNIIGKNCDIDTQIKVLDACINLLQNVRFLQTASFQIGFMCGSVLENTDSNNTSNK